jgi:hypothetical protein
MDIVQLEPINGSVSIGSTPVETEANGILVSSIAKLCTAPTQTDLGCTRYRLLRKVSVCGHTADGAIEVGERREVSVILLFDLIEFFDSSILESKVVRTCEKSWKLKFISNHPSTAFLDSCEWGEAIFSYDAKQGDLSLEIKLKRRQLSQVE